MRKLLLFLAIFAGLLFSGTPIPSIHGATALDFRTEPGIAAGGGYSLTLELGCRANVMLGEGYMLVSPAAPRSSEEACCCTFVPLLRHQ